MRIGAPLRARFRFFGLVRLQAEMQEDLPAALPA